ncbi:hypothetical protein [Halomontanus rarus]|uniref:hypothetical protein n=1 Tax=Halomontanus rarus TaxID=3034020 RepID=UPI0023E78C1A|nr:hypothetical protein [Halovivax sp. TS33]
MTQHDIVDDYTATSDLELYENSGGNAVLHQPGTPAAWLELEDVTRVVTLTEWV